MPSFLFSPSPLPLSPHYHHLALPLLICCGVDHDDDEKEEEEEEGTLHFTPPPHPLDMCSQSHLWRKQKGKLEVWMTVGGEAAQPGLDWHHGAASAHSVGGNKAQCHGNHIKSTLKLIYLQKQWKLCWCLPFFGSRCCFVLFFFYSPISISVRSLLEEKKRKRKNNQDRSCYGLSITQSHI